MSLRKQEHTISLKKFFINGDFHKNVFPIFRSLCCQLLFVIGSVITSVRYLCLLSSQVEHVSSVVVAESSLDHCTQDYVDLTDDGRN